MANIGSRTKTRVLGFSVAALFLIATATFISKRTTEARQEDRSNFSLKYSRPAGWTEELHHNPQTLFSYIDGRTKVSLRGSINQVIFDENPTPELDRDGLTTHFANVTVDHLGWAAKILDIVNCPGGSYRIIRRETTDRIIVSGIAVRGNTTVIVTLSGIGGAKKSVDAHLPFFREFLATTSLEKTVMY
jgi:hypothetical protein